MHNLSLKMGPRLPRHPSSHHIFTLGGRFLPCGLSGAILSSVFGRFLLRVGPERFFSSMELQGVQRAPEDRWEAGMQS